jgi:hypothetical protein
VAQALFDQARKAMAAHDYAEACPKFDESYKVEQALGTLLNLAVCCSTRRPFSGQLPWRDGDEAGEVTHHRARDVVRELRLTAISGGRRPGHELARFPDGPSWAGHEECTSTST